MKRYIKAYGGEPSAAEYGAFLQKRRNEQNERYAPFQIFDFYEYKNIANSTGYRIRLGDKEWILDTYPSFRSYSRGPCKLYGPFFKNLVKDYELYKYETTSYIGEFSGLDSAITYLYELEDVEV